MERGFVVYILIACAVLVACDCDKGVLSSTEEFGDVEVSVDTEWKSGQTEGLYGLTIREQRAAPSGQYQFGITGSGSYLVRREAPGASADSLYTVLVGLTPSAAIRTKGKNHLVVRALGDHFEFLVNGELLVEVTDSTLNTGDVGVFLDGRTKVEFCEMKTRELE